MDRSGLAPPAILRSTFRDAALARQTGMEPRVRAAIEAYAASYAANDVEARLALFAPDAVFEDPVGSVPIVGTAALRNFWETGAAAFRIRMELGNVIINGAEGAFAATVTVSGSRGDTVRIRIVETIMLGADGLVTRLRAFFDVDSIA